MNFNLKAIEFQVASEVKVDQEGKATFSIRAVERLANVSHQTLSASLASAGSISPSKLAQTLALYGFEAGSISEFGKTGVPDIAVAAILSYYAMDAGERCTDQAKAVFRSFAAIGIRAYAHRLAGHDQDVQDYKVALKQLLEEQCPAIPTHYQPRFHKRFWEALEKCYGLKQSDRACSVFIKYHVYGYLPPEVQERLQEVNPKNEDGVRSHRFHQHTDDVVLQLLVARIDAITLLLEAALSAKEFRRLVRRVRSTRFNRNNIKVLRGNS